MSSLLTRYWIIFDVSRIPQLQFRFAWGCGVTAYSYEDALFLIQIQIFEELQQPMPPIKTVVENIDISTLDKNHILPNMGVPVWRGVWFPKRSLWYQPPR